MTDQPDGQRGGSDAPDQDAVGEHTPVSPPSQAPPPPPAYAAPPTYSPPPQQAYPQQAYPQQAYPQQAYPQQAYPQQAYPAAGLPRCSTDLHQCHRRIRLVHRLMGHLPGNPGDCGPRAGQ